MSVLKLSLYSAWNEITSKDETTGFDETTVYNDALDASSFLDSLFGAHSTAYYPKGSFQSNEIELSELVEIGEAFISWQETILSGTTVLVETRLSFDKGVTWSKWQQCLNNQPIPGLRQGVIVENTKLQYRITLSTADPLVTPTVSTIVLNITNRNVQLLTNGTVESFPVITVTFLEAAQSIEIYRDSGGQMLKFLNNFEPGDKLVVDCEKFTVKLNGANALHLLDAASIFWTWLPNVQHQPVVLMNGSRVSVEFRQRPRWI